MTADKELIVHYRKLIEEWREEIASYKSGEHEMFTINSGRRTDTSKLEIEELTQKIDKLTQIVAAYEKRGP
jgi:uncharacterized protein YaaR (DUF327 family)